MNVRKKLLKVAGRHRTNSDKNTSTFKQLPCLKPADATLQLIGPFTPLCCADPDTAGTHPQNTSHGWLLKAKALWVRGVAGVAPSSCGLAVSGVFVSVTSDIQQQLRWLFGQHAICIRVGTRLKNFNDFNVMIHTFPKAGFGKGL